MIVALVTTSRLTKGGSPPLLGKEDLKKHSCSGISKEKNAIVIENARFRVKDVSIRYKSIFLL